MPRISRSRSQAVTFSQYSDLILIPKDKSESKSYTKEENRRMRKALVRDTRELSRKIANSQPGELTDEELYEQLYECIGLEAFATKGLAQYVAETKRVHIHAVLQEQQLQKLHGYCDMNKLASVSGVNSCWARERAQKLALGFLNVLNELLLPTQGLVEKIYPKEPFSTYIQTLGPLCYACMR